MRSIWTTAVVAVVAVGATPPARAAFVPFTNRAAFDAAAPGLPTQTFAAANVPFGGGFDIPNPLDSATDNGVFRPGNILPGLTIRATGPDAGALFVAGINLSGNSFKTVFAASADETLNLIFAPGVGAAGATLLSEPFAGQATVSVFDPADVLQATFTAQAPTSGAGAFFGVVGTAGERIGRINIRTGGGFEGVASVTFGTPAVVAAVPAPPTLLLAGFGAAGFGGLGWARRRPAGAAAG